ncbi:hypothetical protein ACFFVB_10940 [Formosa undariae]|uniref:Phage protein n=1 Tax=Formosa undariae TaxID=1325436 RepID=A0ABV5F2C2_9FLAO
MNKIVFRESPVLEVSFDNTHIHIVDFENELNNDVFYYDNGIHIERIGKRMTIASAVKKIGFEIDENII